MQEIKKKIDMIQLMKDLKTSNNGLSDSEAGSRLNSYGYNEVTEKKDSIYIKFLKKFWAPVPWMLEVTSIITYIIGRYIDTYIILFLLFFNAIIGFFQESRAKNAVELLKKRLQVTSRVLRNGKWELLESIYIVPGDIINVRFGDIVPADCAIISGNVETDQSALTGESLSVSKGVSDQLFSGSVIKRGEATAVVMATGDKTYFGKTAMLVSEAGSRSHIESLIFNIVKYLIILDVSLVIITTIYSILINVPFNDIIPFSLVLLITSIPVALPATFTIAMAIGAMDMAKKGAIVTRLNAIEDAASMDILCSDKTGTITENVLTVRDPYPVGCSINELMELAMYASEEKSEDPIDIAIINFARNIKINIDYNNVKNFIPFDPATKRTEAVVLKNGKTTRILKGAPQVIAGLCGFNYSGISSKIDEFARFGYRVIAVATIDEKPAFKGLIPMYDPPRKDSAELIKELGDLGISVKMVTGDNKEIAAKIAGEVGISGMACNVHENFDVNKCSVFSEVFPEDKFKIVMELQKDGHVTGMTGDGVNDAPALKQAEVGIAVSNATDVAKASASIVLTHQGIVDIVESVKDGRRIYQRMLTYTLNKIIKTIQVVLFLTTAFFAVKFFVTTPFDIILLLFANDFVTM
nr:plasma-membrane proton-efflux P-type ATPase [Picrophilus oshimae]